MPQAKAVLEISKVSKKYSGGVSALRDISLTVHEGDIFGIIGASGAGKSTLIRCLAGLVSPTSGKILFSGKDLFQLSKNELRLYRMKIGMIFQHFNLLDSRTAAGNISFPLEIAKVPESERKKRVEELLELVGLSEKEKTFPAFLSGGEKQRVGIARALANHPEILFCDEATSALDPKTTRDILALLKNIQQRLKITIVLITHEMDVVKQICNKVAVLDRGALVEQGSVVQIFSDPQTITARQLLQASNHDLPEEFFKAQTPNRKLLRLRFKGQAAGEPIIAELVRKFDVSANILMGWIDRVQSTSIGTLIVEMTGETAKLQESLSYLQQKSVQIETLENEL